MQRSTTELGVREICNWMMLSLSQKLYISRENKTSLAKERAMFKNLSVYGIFTPTPSLLMTASCGDSRMSRKKRSYISIRYRNSCEDMAT